MKEQTTTNTGVLRSAQDDGSFGAVDLRSAEDDSGFGGPEGKPAPGFVQGMGLFSATAIVMGSMIGSGIFIVSADMSRTLGSPALLIGAWLLTAAMTIIGALSYGELAAMMPKAGGAVCLPARGAGADLGIPVRVDAVSGNPDGNDCGGGG